MSHEKESMWKVWQKWGSLWDMAVWCPAADPISLRIAGTQIQPLCRILPSSWVGLSTASQELFGDEENPCFYFCPCPKSCDFQVLGCNGEEKGETSVSEPQLLSGSPVKGTFLSWTHWDVCRSLSWKKKVGRCFHTEIQKVLLLNSVSGCRWVTDPLAGTKIPLHHCLTQTVHHVLMHDPQQTFPSTLCLVWTCRKEGRGRRQPHWGLDCDSLSHEPVWFWGLSVTVTHCSRSSIILSSAFQVS